MVLKTKKLVVGTKNDLKLPEKKWTEDMEVDANEEEGEEEDMARMMDEGKE